MGKDLKGKELGKGITQRKEDKRYTARFTNREGKRITKHFLKLQDAREWLATALYEEERNISSPSYLKGLTVDEWFQYWIKEIEVYRVKYTTLQRRIYFYHHYVAPIIGPLLIKDVLPLHIQKINNSLIEKGVKNSSIHTIQGVTKSMFQCAFDNSLIQKNPCEKTINIPFQKGQDRREPLSKREEEQFLFYAKDCYYYRQFLLCLQTGLRCGELIGLRWQDVDFKKRIVHIQNNMVYINNQWVSGPPKSASGIRNIPMTDTVYQLLQELYLIRNPDSVKEEWKDLVFLSHQQTPIYENNYNAAIKNICKKAGIRQISMHIFRHTFATRCVNAGMKPVTLQRILGHASLNMTMDIYVHIGDSDCEEELLSIQNLL